MTPSPETPVSDDERDVFADLTSELLERMDNQLAEWEADETRSLWWQYQTDFAQARDTILALTGNIQ